MPIEMTPQPEQNRKAQSGLTLVETALAVALIGVTVSGSVALLRAVLPGVSAMQRRAVGTQLSQAKAEQLKNELLMQDWFLIPCEDSSLTPTPLPGAYDARLTNIEGIRYVTNWQVYYVDASEALYPLATPYPTIAANVQQTAPSGLLRIRVTTEWTDRRQLRTIENISYLAQRELATPTPLGANPAPTAIQFFEIRGEVTDGGKPIKGGAMILASTLSDPGTITDIRPAWVGPDSTYSAFVGFDGRYVIRFPADGRAYNVACRYVRRLASGANSEVAGTVVSGLTASGNSFGQADFTF